MLVINVKENFEEVQEEVRKNWCCKRTSRSSSFRKALYHQAYAENSCGLQTANANR